MASTYVNDLRLEEMATGDQSGTWGDTTNTNLELIAEAFSYGTQASFGSDADATTTIADGASDPARSLYLKVTSGVSLTATRTLTIAPNTVSKIWIIENATSGSQSISISQGSGANVIIPNGDVKVIYTDGAGAGAAVVDAFTDLNLGGTTTVAALDAGSGAITTTGTVTGGTLAGTLSTAAQPNITSLGTLTGLTTSGDINFGDNDKAIFGAGSDLQIYHDGSNSYISEVGTGALIIQGRDSVTIEDGTSGENYIYMQRDNKVELYYDGSPKLATTSTGINVTGTVVADGLTVDGTTSFLSKVVFDNADELRWKDNLGTERTALVLDSSNNLNLGTSAGGNLVFYNGSSYTERMRINSSGNVGIGTSSPSEKLEIQENTNSTDVKLRLRSFNSSSAGRSTYIAYDPDTRIMGFGEGGNEVNIDQNGNVGIGTVSPNLHGWAKAVTLDTATNAGYELGQSGTKYGAFALQGDGRVQLTNFTSNPLTFQTNNTERMRIDSSGNVGIGHNSPGGFSSGANNLVVNDAAGAGGITIVTPNNAKGSIFFADGTGATGQGRIRYNHDGDYMTFGTSGSEDKLVIDSSGNVGIGTTSPSTALEVNNASAGATVATFEGSYSASGDVKLASFERNGGAVAAAITYADAATAMEFGTTTSHSLILTTGDTERMRIDSSGNVGIGTSSPSANLHVNRNTNTANNVDSLGFDVAATIGNAATNPGNHFTSGLRLFQGSGTVGSGLGVFYIGADNGTAAATNDYTGQLYAPSGMTGGIKLNAADSSGTVRFETAGSERMRIDSSGNFIVGNTSAFDSSSFCVDQSGLGQFRRDGTPLIIRRDGSDGNLINFEKDGATVGSIGTAGSALVLGNGNAGFYFNSSLSTVMPWSITNNTNSDAAIDIGQSSNRFKDLYLSGGAYLGGTGSANHLDDYEEGNWTPVFNNFTATGTTSNTGLYVKVGRLVYVELNLNLSSPSYTGGGSGTYITGLPFSPSGQLVVSVGASTLFNTATYLDNNGGGNNLFFKTNRNTISGIGSVSFMNSSGYLRFSATYYSSA